MARPEKPGDKFTNARKRYRRAAERYLKKAEQSSGITAERYRALAREDLKKALDTYDKSTTQAFAKPIQTLAEKLGVNLSAKRKELKQKSDTVASRLRTMREKDSRKRLESAMKDVEDRRQEEARVVFSSPIGQRIIGGLVDVWRDKATYTVTKFAKDGTPYQATEVDKKLMFEAIFEYLKVDNLADALAKMEKALGDRLYRDGDVDTIYETVKLIIQSKVADNTLVA